MNSLDKDLSTNVTSPYRHDATKISVLGGAAVVVAAGVNALMDAFSYTASHTNQTAQELAQKSLVTDGSLIAIGAFMLSVGGRQTPQILPKSIICRRVADFAVDLQ